MKLHSREPGETLILPAEGLEQDPPLSCFMDSPNANFLIFNIHKPCQNMKTVHMGTSIELTNGDITTQKDIDTVVNAANAQLLPGGGVAGAIHRAAGPGLKMEAVPLGPIKPGEAVITGAHDLPNKHVIHCLGPVYGQDRPEEKLLANCYRNALQLAEKEGIGSVAFPSISTGAFGYPLEDAAEVALETIRESTGELDKVKLIRMVLYSNKDLEVYQDKMKKIFDL